MKRTFIFIAGLLVAVSLQAQQPIDYQQRFKAAIAQLDTCQECAVEQLLEIKKAAFVPDLVRLNTTIVLANICVNKGDIESLDNLLSDIVQYTTLHSDDTDVAATLHRLQKQRGELLKQQESFRDRLVGTWVAAEVDKLGLPWLRLSIGRDSTFWASIQDKSQMSFYLKKDMLFTENIDINGLGKEIILHFGAERNKKSNTFMANIWREMATDNATAVARYKSNTGKTSLDGDITTIMLMSFAKNAAVAKTKYLLLDMQLTEVAPDILRGMVFYEQKTLRSDEKEDETDEKRMRTVYLYRISPQDKIYFSNKNREIESFPYRTKMGWDVLPYDTLTIREQQKDALTKPDGKNFSIFKFNQISMKKLQSKIMNHIGEIEPDVAERVTGELEYGPQGYAWNDGRYLNGISEIKWDGYNVSSTAYDEKYKGPYMRKLYTFLPFYSYGSKWDYECAMWVTIEDFWKTFERRIDGIYIYPNYKVLEKNRKIPKYIMMKYDFEAKHPSKSKKKYKEVEE